MTTWLFWATCFRWSVKIKVYKWCNIANMKWQLWLFFRTSTILPEHNSHTSRLCRFMKRMVSFSQILNVLSLNFQHIMFVDDSSRSIQTPTVLSMLVTWTHLDTKSSLFSLYSPVLHLSHGSLRNNHFRLWRLAHCYQLWSILFKMFQWHVQEGRPCPFLIRHYWCLSKRCLWNLFFSVLSV